MLIERGAKVNQKDDYGQTPLHCAAENACGAESCRIAALLLEHGADVNARAKYREPGRTALECAVLGGRTELVRLLLEHGADEADDYHCDDACSDQFPTLIFYDAAGRPICWLDWKDFYPPLEGKYPNLFALPPSVFSALDSLIIRRLPAAARPSEGRARS